VIARQDAVFGDLEGHVAADRIALQARLGHRDSSG
jgi:hypothetical protein